MILLVKSKITVEKKEFSFIKYAYLFRKEGFLSDKYTEEDSNGDLENKKFLAEAKRTYGLLSLVTFLNGLNDSLRISRSFKMPVAVDSIHINILN